MSALLSTITCSACLWSCWPMFLGVFVLGGWVGMVALALMVMQKDPEDRP